MLKEMVFGFPPVISSTFSLMFHMSCQTEKAGKSKGVRKASSSGVGRGEESGDSDKLHWYLERYHKTYLKIMN